MMKSNADLGQVEVQENIDNKGILLNQYKIIRTELPKILPIVYLCMIGIGMIFNYYKYDRFGINIFQYASVFDFLISPFEDYIIILFTLLSLVFCTLVYYVDCLFEKKFSKTYAIFSFRQSGKKRYPLVRFYILVGTILVYIWLMAMIYGHYTYAQVLEQQNVTVKYHDNEIVEGKQIGKTNEVLFVLDENKKTRAIPIHSLVKEIRY